MPYQSAPPLVIITLAFGAVGGLIKLNNYLFLGRSDRKLRVDPFDIRRVLFVVLSSLDLWIKANSWGILRPKFERIRRKFEMSGQTE